MSSSEATFSLFSCSGANRMKTAPQHSNIKVSGQWKYAVIIAILSFCVAAAAAAVVIGALGLAHHTFQWLNFAEKLSLVVGGGVVFVAALITIVVFGLIWRKSLAEASSEDSSRGSASLLTVSSVTPNPDKVSNS